MLYAGVISLGVGDTMASVGGKMFGKHKWPGRYILIHVDWHWFVNTTVFLVKFIQSIIN